MKKKKYTLTFSNAKCIALPEVGEYKWIIIDGYKTDYIINSLGFVISTNYKRSGKSVIMKEYIKKSGYHVVTIHAKKKEYKMHVHRLVAEAFIEKVEGKDCVNHINVPNIKDKSDNSVYNLEWVTVQENNEHAKVNKLVPSGERHYWCKYTNKQTEEICKLLEENKKTMREIAKLTNTAYHFVVAVKNRKMRTEISQFYKIDNYTVKQKIENKEKYYDRNHYVSFTDEQLHTICKLLSDNKLSMQKISEITNVPYRIIFNIRHKKIKNKRCLKIMENYNYSSYNVRNNSKND